MNRIQTVDALHPSSRVMARAGELLRASRLVAYPTETFYGLGADPGSEAAVEAVYVAKGRPDRMALPLIASDLAAVRSCVEPFPDVAERLAGSFWPGALTLVLFASRALPSRLLGGGRTVGIRISPHPVAAALAAAFGGAVVATSANRSGLPAPATAAEVETDLGDALAMILDAGATRGGLASTVIDLSVDPPRVVRSGAIPLAAIEKVLGRRID